MAKNNNNTIKKNSNKSSSTKKNKVEIDNNVKIIGVDLASNVAQNVKSTFSQVHKPIVEQLRSEIDIIKERNNQLETWWDNQGHELFTNLITTTLYHSNDANLCDGITDEEFQLLVQDSNLDIPIGGFGFDYKFIRTKLWDEGINLKIDLTFNMCYSIKQPSDTFDDCILFYPAHDTTIKSHLRDPWYLTTFAQYTGMSVEDVGMFIRKQYYSLPI